MNPCRTAAVGSVGQFLTTIPGSHQHATVQHNDALRRSTTQAAHVAANLCYDSLAAWCQFEITSPQFVKWDRPSSRTNNKTYTRSIEMRWPPSSNRQIVVASKSAPQITDFWANTNNKSTRLPWSWWRTTVFAKITCVSAHQRKSLCHGDDYKVQTNTGTNPPLNRLVNQNDVGKEKQSIFEYFPMKSLGFIDGKRYLVERETNRDCIFVSAIIDFIGNAFKCHRLVRFWPGCQYTSSPLSRNFVIGFHFIQTFSSSCLSQSPYTRAYAWSIGAFQTFWTCMKQASNVDTDIKGIRSLSALMIKWLPFWNAGISRTPFAVWLAAMFTAVLLEESLGTRFWYRKSISLVWFFTCIEWELQTTSFEWFVVKTYWWTSKCDWPLSHNRLGFMLENICR